MELRLIFPRWPKLEHQTVFHLPPHGPVVFAAAVPEEVDIDFVDENVQELDFEKSTDLVGISVLLSCQLPRAFQIADHFRQRGVPVLFGGIATMLHAKEVLEHADSVFLGEVEGRFDAVIRDFENGRLKRIYDYLADPPDVGLIRPAKRSILKRELYNYRGVQMVDLVHASRGCRFNCFPCSVAFLGGRQFRPRPLDAVINEMESIPNNRFFIVDNSLAQDRSWLIDLFTAMRPLRKKWVSHPILYDQDVLKLAAEAGCWYVYQAIIDTSDVMRERIKMLKAYGIGIEGTILLGTDDQNENDIKRLVDFCMAIDLDMAEFTILTPFPHTPIRAKYEKEGRILHNNWIDYSCDKVVFRPKQISPDRLQALYHDAWNTFYANGGYQLKMGNLFLKVIKKEMQDGTYKRHDSSSNRSFPKSRPTA